MTPENQVKEIVQRISPENKQSTDAVFAVDSYIKKTNERIAALQKQVDLLEAIIEQRSQEKHDAINEKLASEARLQKEKEDIIKERTKDKE